jgi:hypothetical protein
MTTNSARFAFIAAASLGYAEDSQGADKPTLSWFEVIKVERHNLSAKQLSRRKNATLPKNYAWR